MSGTYETRHGTASILGTYELETNIDHSIQLRIHTPKGMVDLVFTDGQQFLDLVAGQHVPTATELLQAINADTERTG